MPLKNSRHKRRLLWLLERWQREHPTRPVSLVQLAQELGTTRHQVRTLYDELAAAHELPPVSKRGFASMDRVLQRQLLPGADMSHSETDGRTRLRQMRHDGRENSVGESVAKDLPNTKGELFALPANSGRPSKGVNRYEPTD